MADMHAHQSGYRGLLARLDDGPVICAEGYVFELERRGHLQAGAFVPEVVLDHPEAVRELHDEFIRAGSDVVEALTYYGHREKLRVVGKEDTLEELNRTALRLARRAASDAAAKLGIEQPLVAGNVCNTNVFRSDDRQAAVRVRGMLDEQIGWVTEEGVDFVIGETFYSYGEARIAAESIKASGLPAVITFAVPAGGTLLDGYRPGEAAKRLVDDGADVVGVNCFRGPATTLPLADQIREAVACPVAALPVPYRTTSTNPTFFTLTDEEGEPAPNGRPFPTALEPFLCTRYDVARFAREAVASGVRYLGLCCGGAPHFVRAMAEAVGRSPAASVHSPDMSKHFAFGTDPRVDLQGRSVATAL
ncbi:MAG: homocysteine S-methyltransferase family protein [Streptosporangiales bacterium]